MSEFTPPEGIVIGLFGTCDNSPWRLPFIERYTTLGIDYFNPDYGDNWHPGCIPEENWHLNNDQVILFPVLAESLGQGSLGEIGFSISNVLRNLTKNGQYLIVLIDDECTDERKTEAERNNSNRMRKLVKSKVRENVCYPVVTLVDSLDEMFERSLEILDVAKRREELEADQKIA